MSSKISIGLVLVFLALMVERATTFPTSLQQQQQQQQQELEQEYYQQQQHRPDLWSRVNRDLSDSLENRKHRLAHFLTVSLYFFIFQDNQ